MEIYYNGYYYDDVFQVSVKACQDICMQRHIYPIKDIYIYLYIYKDICIYQYISIRPSLMNSFDSQI